jgi:hypothetical protein
MVRGAAPKVGYQEVRLAALYIRKTRNLKKDQKQMILSLPTPRIDEALKFVGTADNIDLSLLPAAEGLIDVLDGDSHLYISRSGDLHAAAKEIVSESSLRFMSNDFWAPKRDRMTIKVFAGHSFMKIPVSQWQLKLISEKKPFFNWPVAA